MTIEEFSAHIKANLSAFVTATRRMQEQGEDGFVGPKFENRTEADWRAEWSAYNQYTELTEGGHALPSLRAPAVH
jgi:hypothetical protein